ncbi:hypothetical protein DPM13_15055 [Paracoccus mutanolyticus]|uniref:Uncharacterized protein n=1 Tax=Paracoccus mutanolyticus TaxID=1499308 RepID=A0ABM6WTJ6_9RHOB|nr:hypothetical protein [Paracoccus mutanolyticus]AWX93889.1 hypothetical protein DPM13_15055 [Paracoccus mutanolyticus]
MLTFVADVILLALIFACVAFSIKVEDGSARTVGAAASISSSFVASLAPHGQLPMIPSTIW